MPAKSFIGRTNRIAGCRLKAPGWNPATRHALEKLLRAGAFKQHRVVFDFDNTIIHGDIGEATFAVLERTGKLTAAALPATLTPAFRPKGKDRVTLAQCGSLADYYAALLAPTGHGKNDPAPLANAYAWVVEIMAGLPLTDVIEATRAVWKLAQAEPPESLTVPPGTTAFPVPRFYAEMVELLAVLLRHDFDVWIVSASNVWSVRWTVLQELNPRLRVAADGRGIAADHVIGVSTLLADADDRLWKDAVLVRENPGYAAMATDALRPFRLTGRLQFPLPAYSGKVACIHDAFGEPPYLCAGDGPGDHAMLSVSRHRLWIARAGKPLLQQATAALVRRTGAAGWMIQASAADAVQRFLEHHRHVPAAYDFLQPPPETLLPIASLVMA